MSRPYWEILYEIPFSLKKKKKGGGGNGVGGTRENAQWLRAFTVLEKDWVQFSAPISGGSHFL